jgi:hypothetical protein
MTEVTACTRYRELPRENAKQGRVEAAIECLRTVLQVAPDYADAMFNLALLLQ